MCRSDKESHSLSHQSSYFQVPGAQPLCLAEIQLEQELSRPSRQSLEGGACQPEILVGIEVHQTTHDIADGHSLGKHSRTKPLAPGTIVGTGLLSEPGQQGTIRF